MPALLILSLTRRILAALLILSLTRRVLPALLILPLTRRILPALLILSLTRRVLAALLILSLTRRILPALLILPLARRILAALLILPLILNLALSIFFFLLNRARFLLNVLLNFCFLFHSRHLFFGFFCLRFRFLRFCNGGWLTCGFRGSFLDFLDFRLLCFRSSFRLFKCFLLLLYIALFFGFCARNAHQLRFNALQRGQMVLNARLQRFHSSHRLL